MSSHIQKSCVGLEATLSDSKKKYGDKVNTLLSAWEHVTNFIPTATPETTQSLIEWAYKHTLTLVLRGEWPKLSPATRTHLLVTLQRCAKRLLQHPAAPKCSSLISLVNNPWANADLDLILNGQPDAKHEEEFCCSEKGELLTMRLKILCEDRCEDIAVNLAAACVRSLRRSDRLRSVSDVHHVQYMIDVYIVLLYKLKRTQDIFAQLKLMDLSDGLELVQRLSGEKPTKYGTARVWRNSTKAAELVAQYLVTAGMVRPVAETGANTLEQILNSWASLHSKLKDIAPTLPGMIRKLIEPAESAQHIYIFCAVLSKHFGDNMKPLVIELYIRALTTDMNELENQKAKSDKEKVRETAKRLSAQFLKLADVVGSNVGIARECVLTAFSLHPTRTCFDRIKEIAIACGKAKEDIENIRLKSDTPKVEAKEEITPNPTAFCQSLLLSSPSAKSKNLDLQNNLLLKSLLSSPTKKETAGIKCNPDEPCLEQKELPNTHVERTLDALILIKGEAVTGSANYDEKSVPNQVLDAEKLGLSAQLCDDLSVVLSSPRYHMLSWVLDWKELNSLCERYLENAEEMRNTNKELKYLNIDYSQFKDWPSDDDSKDVFFGIEKGYEQWVDLPSDSSEQFGSFQPAGNYKRSTVRRSLDDSTDSDSGSMLRVRRVGRPRKVHRLESSESDYDSEEQQHKPKHFRSRTSSVSDSDTNTQDSQTDSLGSDGCRQESNKESIKKQHFRMLVNDNLHHSTEDASGSDVSSSDIITLFSADMDENKRETIKGSAYTAAAPLIITEKRSDPAVLKSLRMFRPQNSKKKPKRMMSQMMLTKSGKDNNNVSENNPTNTGKFAPMLSTLNLNPKIVLTRADEIDRKLTQSKKKKKKKKQQHQQQQQFSTGDIKSQLMNIQKSMKGSASGKKASVKSNLGKTKFDILAKAVRDSDILAKNVPGMNSLDMMVPPRVQSTVNVVQLSRNIPQSPNSGSGNSGHTPPRNRTSSLAGSIQLPGTPSSGGHDSGVGMSPAGQTPPPRSSSLHDVGEEANQPPDASPTDSTNAPDSQSQSPKKSPSPSSTTTTSLPINSEQIQLVCKPDGTYQLASINPNAISAQRGVLTLQNLDEAFPRQQQPQQQPQQTSSRNTFDRLTPINKDMSHSGQNTGLPKFQQAFGKTIYTLSSDATTVAASSTTDTVTQPKTTNLSKAVQTSVPSAQPGVQPIANIPNLQVSGNRQILNIVQNSAAANNASQTLTQLVQTMQNSSSGVIYTHKIPVTISTTNPSQLNIIPTISHANSTMPGNRTPVVKLNIIRAGTPIRQQNIAGTIQAVLTAPRLQQSQQQQQPQQQQQQQPPQQQQQQQQQAVRTDSLINSPIEVPNQVSSTTLEQLREFESVLEQVKERSTIQPQNASTTTVQTQTAQTPTKQPQQQLLIPSQSSSNSEFSSNGGTVTFQQQQQQQQDNQQIFQQKVSLAYVNQSGPKITNSTPVVVVTSYCQPSASPALSVTSQSSSSPCVTPAPASAPSVGKTTTTTTSAASPKAAKKATPKAVKSSATNTSKVSPIAKPQQKPQEDEQTTQRIYAILTEYAEQLRNSPDLNNKPAPRRRSNPPTNPSQSSKRKKSSSGKSKPVGGQQTSELSPSADDLGRTMGSEDSSSGVAHVQDSPAGFSAPEEPISGANDASTEARNDSNDDMDLGSAKRRNLIFTEQNAVQPRAVIVQEAVQTASVSVSEALASVTGKMGNAAVLVPGTNYILPMNLMKGGQQFTIVSGGSKLLATVPATVRSTGSGGVSNTLVLQSFLNSAAGKIISQPAQVKQVKLPTLQNLSSGQQQNAAVVIPPQNNAHFTEDTASEKKEPMADVGNEPATTNAILVNKTQAIGIIPRNIAEDGHQQQHICGVITSNPNLALQGTRIFNSSIAKLAGGQVGMKTESVVCLASTTTVGQGSEKRTMQEVKTQGEKQVQATAIALAFATQPETINNGQQQKEIKETVTDMIAGDKAGSTKAVKRKIDDGGDNARTLVVPNSVSSSTLVTSLHSNTKIETSSAMSVANKQAVSLDNSSQYLSSSGPSNSGNHQESSTVRQSMDSVESSCKVGNGVLCGNARLQEAWEPERKSSPDTPWRYVPTSTTSLNLEPLKVYPRESSAETADNVHNVLQIMNKNQVTNAATIEISGQQQHGYHQQTKKYLMNNSLEQSFQQYTNKSQKAQSNQRLDRELLQQRMERKAAAIERELRLQKSLSEECEDLGVDEPSTSDLFPEADLLFDTNHSPSFDHSSQDASCSQSLGMKSSYGSSSSYFRPLDSSSGSRDVSPIARKNSLIPKITARAVKEPVKRTKKMEDTENNPSKHIRLSYENLCQDSAGSSNSDKEPKSASKEGTPSSSMELDSESANQNNVASSGDESLTLLGSSTADVTIPSPLSPIAGPLLSTKKYTYANKKRRINKFARPDYLAAWESPVSERTRSSSEDDDSSVGDSSQNEDQTVTNGLEKIGDHCTYLKKDKLQVNARVVLNRADAQAILAKHIKSSELTMLNEANADKLSEASDDEHHHASAEPDCRARRSSLRGHVKKGCACCNGSPERPKKKPVKLDHGKLKKRLVAKPLGKKR